MSSENTKSSSAIHDLVVASLHLIDSEWPAICYGIDASSENLLDSQRQLISRIASLLDESLTSPSQIGFSGPSLSLLPPLLNPSDHRLVNLSTDSVDDSQLFDVVVIEGSVRNIDQLGLLNDVRAKLKEGGRLVLFGEYIEDDSQIKRSELSNLTTLLQLSDRLGFECLSQDDQSSGAKHSIDLLLEHVQSNQTSIVDSLDWNEPQLNDALELLRDIKEEFISGRRRFGLIVFAKSLTNADENAQAVYGDIHSFQPQDVSTLFVDSFGAEFDPELWAWKYQADKGVCVVAREFEGGEIVSHYGGAPRDILYFGQPSLALQSCDVMVAPKLRRHYGKKSLFFKTAATFLEREEGNIAKHLLGFGFPNQSAMNIALRLGLYEKTDVFVELAFIASDTHEDEYEFEDIDITNHTHTQQLDELWEQMSSGFDEGIIGLRNANYFDYRYFQHPFAARGLLTRKFIRAKTSGEMIAAIVLKDHEEQRLLLDIVGPLDRLPVLLQLANSYVSVQEEKAMKFWLTKGWLDKLETTGCAVNELGIEIPCNSWNPGPSADVLYGKWWLTAGDMDFV